MSYAHKRFPDLRAKETTTAITSCSASSSTSYLATLTDYSYQLSCRRGRSRLGSSKKIKRPKLSSPPPAGAAKVDR